MTLLLAPQSQASPQVQTWGIDTIKISYPVNPDLCDLSNERWLRRTGPKSQNFESTFEDLYQVVTVGSTDVRLTYYRNPETASLEFNAASWSRQHPYDLLHPKHLEPVILGLIHHLTPLLWPTFCWWDRTTGELTTDAHWPHLVRNRRIDVARNFAVDDPEALLQGLLGVRGRYQKNWSLDRGRNNGWTLTQKTKRNGRDRLYHKSSESPLPDDPAMLVYNGEVVRFETQLQGQRLKTLAMSSVAAVSTKASWDALETRWHATGWGSPICRRGEVIAATGHLPLLKQERLLGYLHLKAAGEISRMDKSHERTFGSLARTCGLQAGLPVESLGTADRHLDLKTGTYESLM